MCEHSIHHFNKSLMSITLAFSEHISQLNIDTLSNPRGSCHVLLQPLSLLSVRGTVHQLFMQKTRGKSSAQTHVIFLLRGDQPCVEDRLILPGLKTH